VEKVTSQYSRRFARPLAEKYLHTPLGWAASEARTGGTLCSFKKCSKIYVSICSRESWGSSGVSRGVGVARPLLRDTNLVPCEGFGLARQGWSDPSEGWPNSPLHLPQRHTPVLLMTNWAWSIVLFPLPHLKGVWAGTTKPKERLSTATH
jgi:hypothetical protein